MVRQKLGDEQYCTQREYSIPQINLYNEKILPIKPFDHKKYLKTIFSSIFTDFSLILKILEDPTYNEHLGVYYKYGIYLNFPIEAFCMILYKYYDQYVKNIRKKSELDIIFNEIFTLINNDQIFLKDVKEVFKFFQVRSGSDIKDYLNSKNILLSNSSHYASQYVKLAREKSHKFNELILRKNLDLCVTEFNRLFKKYVPYKMNVGNKTLATAILTHFGTK